MKALQLAAAAVAVPIIVRHSPRLASPDAKNHALPHIAAGREKGRERGEGGARNAMQLGTRIKDGRTRATTTAKRAKYYSYQETYTRARKTPQSHRAFVPCWRGLPGTFSQPQTHTSGEPAIIGEEAEEKGGDGRRGWSGGDQRGKGGRRECEQEIVKREGRSKISGRQQAKSAISFRPTMRVGKIDTLAKRCFESCYQPVGAMHLAGSIKACAEVESAGNDLRRTETEKRIRRRSYFSAMHFKAPCQ